MDNEFDNMADKRAMHGVQSENTADTKAMHGTQSDDTADTKAMHGTQSDDTADMRSMHAAQSDDTADMRAIHGTQSDDTADTKAMHGTQSDDTADMRAMHAAQSDDTADMRSMHAAQSDDTADMRAIHGTQSDDTADTKAMHGTQSDDTADMRAMHAAQSDDTADMRAMHAAQSDDTADMRAMLGAHPNHTADTRPMHDALSDEAANMKAMHGAHSDNTADTRAVHGTQSDNTANKRAIYGAQSDDGANKRVMHGALSDEAANMKAMHGTHSDNTADTRAMHGAHSNHTADTRAIHDALSDEAANMKVMHGTQSDDAANMRAMHGARSDDAVNKRAMYGAQFDDAANKRAMYGAQFDDAADIRAMYGPQFDDTAHTRAMHGAPSDDAANKRAMHGAQSDDTADMRAMYGADSPWQVPELPLVSPGPDHVMLHAGWNGPSALPPKPVDGSDKWDQYHVKMPYSERNSFGTKKRWNVIKKALSKPINSSDDLAAAIRKYNDTFQYEWQFLALHKFINEVLDQNESEDFFKNTLPKIICLALQVTEIVKAPIPLLKQHTNMSISMSQQQVASLLANAFLCTFPRRNTTGPGSEFANYPRINFTQLYERIDLENTVEKLKCLVHYFKRVTTLMPTGVVTYTRRALDKTDFPRWERSGVPVGSVPVYVDDHLCIEDAEGLIQVDFANKYLGGGVLGRGCVQEEIRFLICPELIASMLFTEKLEANEAVVMIGCERYSKYTGYGRGFHFDGDFEDRTPIDSSGRRRCAVLAIDAVLYYDTSQQYRKGMIDRELNKAWTGFSYDGGPLSPNLRYPGVATGNWGCGAFRGSPQLKSLLQLMACAQARRPMAYLSFGDAKVKDEVVAVYNLLKQHGISVGQLYDMIQKYCKRKPSVDLHAFLDQQLNYPVNEPRSRSVSPEILNTVSDDSSDDDIPVSHQSMQPDPMNFLGNFRSANRKEFTYKSYSGVVRAQSYEGTSVNAQKPRNSGSRGRGRRSNASSNRTSSYPASTGTLNVDLGHPAAKATTKTNPKALGTKASSNSNDDLATTSSNAFKRDTTAVETNPPSHTQYPSNRAMNHTRHNAAANGSSQNIPIHAATTPSQSRSYINSATFHGRTVKPVGKSLDVPGGTNEWNSGGTENRREVITTAPKRKSVPSPDLVENPSTSRDTRRDRAPRRSEQIQKNSPSSSTPISWQTPTMQTISHIQQIVLWPAFRGMAACAIVFAVLTAVVKYTGLASLITRYLNSGLDVPEEPIDDDTTQSPSSTVDLYNTKADEDLHSNDNEELSWSSPPEKPRIRKREPRGKRQGSSPPSLLNIRTTAKEDRGGRIVEETDKGHKRHEYLGYLTKQNTSDNNIQEQRVRENEERDYRHANENRENEDGIKESTTSKQELQHQQQEHKLESPEDFHNNIKCEQNDINEEEDTPVEQSVTVDIQANEQSCNQCDVDSRKRKKVDETHCDSRKTQKVNHEWNVDIKAPKVDYKSVPNDSVPNDSVPNDSVPNDSVSNNCAPDSIQKGSILDDSIPKNGVTDYRVLYNRVPGKSGLCNSVPDNSVPDTSVPDNSVTDNSVTDNSVTDNSLPDNNVPDNSVPDNSVPDNSVSDNNVPDNSVPDNNVPDNSVPDNSVPDDNVPDDSEPDVSSQFRGKEDEKCVYTSITTVANEELSQTRKFDEQCDEQCKTINVVKIRTADSVTLTIKSKYKNSHTIIEIEKGECSDGLKTLNADDECAVDSTTLKIDDESRVDNITLKVDGVRSHDSRASKVYNKCTDDRSGGSTTPKSDEVCGENSALPKVNVDCGEGGIISEQGFVEDGVSPKASGGDRKTTKVSEKWIKIPKLNKLRSDDCAILIVDETYSDDDDSSKQVPKQKNTTVRCVYESGTEKHDNECTDCGITPKNDEKFDNDSRTPNVDEECADNIAHPKLNEKHDNEIGSPKVNETSDDDSLSL